MEIINTILSHINLSVILQIFIITIGAYLFIQIIYHFEKRIEDKFKIDMTNIYILNDVLKYIIILLAIAWILELFGVNLSGIFLSIGVIGIIISVTTKDIISNFLSGLFILTDKSIKVGDVISTDGKKGTIKKIGFRNITLVNQDNQTITLPNSIFNLKHYVKYRALEDYRLKIKVQLFHNIKIEDIQTDIEEIVKKYDWINKEKDILIIGDSINEFGPIIIVNVWITEYKLLDESKLILINEINQLIHNKYLKEPLEK